MIFHRRIAYFTTVLIGFAVPVAANNPPRPDGVLYLILVFPLLAIAGHLAEASPVQRSAAGKVGRVVFFTFVILASAAGTEIGFFAAFVIMLYGIVRSFRILSRGIGGKRYVYAVIALLGTIAAGFGYLWAASSMNSYMYNLSRQKRTMSDMRALSTALQTWAIDQYESTQDETTTPSTPRSANSVDPITEPISFSNDAAPPMISTAELTTLLVPKYIRVVPEADAWDNPFEVRLDQETYRVMIRSSGKDGEFERDIYQEGSFEPREFENDIVHADARFTRWPEKQQN